MKMAGKYVFPDPNDRSKNNPCTIMDSKKVLGVYNQGHPDEEDMQKVTDKVQDWVTDEAIKLGWDDAKFVGNQCILENQFKK